MPGEFYFMAVGGLGVSLVGFAGLISALDRRPAAHSAVAAWRIRNVVFFGFSVTFIGFGTIAVYTAIGGNLTLTARIASLLLAAHGIVWMWQESRSGPAWPNERQRKNSIAVGWVVIALNLGNVVVGDLAYLQFLVLGQLANGASIFINTVRDSAGASP